MPYEEKRRAPRRQTNAEAVATLGVQTRSPCTILDINDFGARLEVEPGQPPETFYLVEVKGAAAHRAKVVWRRPPLVGLSFLQTWDLDAPGVPAWLTEIHSLAQRDRNRARGVEPARWDDD